MRSTVPAEAFRVWEREGERGERGERRAIRFEARCSVRVQREAAACNLSLQS